MTSVFATSEQVEKADMATAAGRPDCRSGAPIAIVSDHLIGDTAGDLRSDDALANWQRWTAQGEAIVINGVLCLTSPEMTDEEWEARFVTGH